MDSNFFSEDEFKALSEDLRGNTSLAFFKMVDVASSARDKIKGEAQAISDIVNAVPGYYIFSSNSQELRETLHIYVDSMMDAVENSHDKK